jgi:hypothetical protein
MNWIKRLLRHTTQESQPQDFGYVTIIYIAGKEPVVVHDSLGLTTPLSQEHLPLNSQTWCEPAGDSEIPDYVLMNYRDQPFLRINPATSLPMFSELFDIRGNLFDMGS